jgi:Polyketide cyclase / dehydrase and lipid transport
MATVRRTQVIDRPPADVFAAIVDLESYPSWNPTTKRARKLSEGETGEGTRFELAIRGFGTTIQELRGFEHDRRVTLVPHVRALSGGHTFVLTPVDGRTRVDHELEMTPRGAWRVLAPRIPLLGRRNLRETASALQAWLERPPGPSDPSLG